MEVIYTDEFGDWFWELSADEEVVLPIGGIKTGDTMSTNKWSNLRDKRFSKEKAEEIREDALREAIGLKLKQLRETAGITQAELADLIGSDQPEVSRLEERENLLLSTLQDYIHALGGRIEVNAVIDDERVSLVKE